ncbi:MAG: nuclear transport factor 2 family protein [Xanthobacteraceae bacterium]|jgi:ketosteroid isomerase-like protein|nr:nuclear transport factor 2 family protein [Hyphomicrobiales bacterium]MBN8984212.1 nuclear transport factor 2 family protein [Hyphomicrobiales bacterium]MBN9002800.1 nuclear transport factor 2 family protein [Hyphomicrobiales bacterium]
MESDSNRQCVLDFLQAFYAGDVAAAMACCDNEIDTITYAPVDLFPHLGHKHGRAWVAEAIAIQQQRYAVRKHEVIFIAAEDSRVAAMTRCALTKRNDGRVVQFTEAEFFALREGRITEHRAFFDSFDLVQQVLGHDLADEFATSVRGAMEH